MLIGYGDVTERFGCGNKFWFKKNVCIVWYVCIYIGVPSITLKLVSGQVRMGNEECHCDFLFIQLIPLLSKYLATTSFSAIVSKIPLIRQILVLLSSSFLVATTQQFCDA